LEKKKKHEFYDNLSKNLGKRIRNNRDMRVLFKGLNVDEDKLDKLNDEEIQTTLKQAALNF